MIGVQENINKKPIPNPQIINRPSDSEEQIEEKPNQNIENINGQDYITEVLNISKVKEGFYIGDKLAAISIEVVVQFKLTHIINATGSQVINQWESIGMKYLTLNWEESNNQILFDPKDEIADKILFFVEDSFINGEGILAHSFKGKNRVCIVVLIYLMKKYKWSLKKSMEYLKSKKQDVDIPPYFLSQLIKFESRLLQKGELTKDIPWSFENLKDPEEKLLRNTYMNGINSKKINRSNLNENKGKIRHIQWIDNIDSNQQIPISVINLDKDLYFKKNIKPIFIHKQIKPSKPCIKKPQKKFMRFSSNKNMKKENEEKNMNINNILKTNNSNILISGSKIYNNIIKNDENNNKLINSIPIKNSNINKKNNIFNPKDNINEIHTNLEKNIEILKVPNRKGLNINKNYLRSSNSEENLLNNSTMKSSIKSSIKRSSNNENIQLNNQQQNQNNFYVNSYNLSNSNSSKNYFNDNTQSNSRQNNNYTKNDSNNNIQISKFTENEINNFKIYDEKGNKINNIINIKNRRKDHSYNRRDEKKENVIIIANKCDNIIKNNINNFYINSIGTINNNMNNSQLTNNYNYKNNTFNNNYNTNKENKNNNNKIIPIANMKKKSYKRKNELDQIDINEIKDITNKTFNNSNNKLTKNSIKNILGNNHRQILGINNNNENNYFILKQNTEVNNNDLESDISPKNIKPDKKIIYLTNNNNGRKFKIIENTNLKNYNSNDNILTNNNTKKRNFNNNNNNNTNINTILENNQKLNRHNHNFNIIITTKKGIKNTQTSPNHFISQISPKNINLTSTSNTMDKFDEAIISNYNPIKKNNRNNRLIPNIKNKNYYNNDIENNNRTMNINNYNISSNSINKPLNNFNPNLIKRKGTPTAGHQSIKINNANNNPIKLKNNILTNNNFKKPSTPDMFINKSMTMIRNNNNYMNNNLFNSNSSINLNKSALFNNNNKTKKLKNYASFNNINNMARPSTAPHKGDKEKNSKEKKRKQIIHHIHESKKGINNYNRNAIKFNVRPSSAGQGKNNSNSLNNNINIKENKEYNSIKYNDKNNKNSNNIIHIGSKIELDLENNYIGRRRLGSPAVINNNKINLVNNNIKYNYINHRLPSPMIKQNDLNGNNFVSNINRTNTSTNYNNINKNNSFSLK